jgi:hypothetical protein
MMRLAVALLLLAACDAASRPREEGGPVADGGGSMPTDGAVTNADAQPSASSTDCDQESRFKITSSNGDVTEVSNFYRKVQVGISPADHPHVSAWVCDFECAGTYCTILQAVCPQGASCEQIGTPMPNALGAGQCQWMSGILSSDGAQAAVQCGYWVRTTVAATGQVTEEGYKAHKVYVDVY